MQRFEDRKRDLVINNLENLKKIIEPFCKRGTFAFKLPNIVLYCDMDNPSMQEKLKWKIIKYFNDQEKAFNLTVLPEVFFGHRLEMIGEPKNLIIILINKEFDECVS